eukprot:gene6174-7151_t
MWKAVVANYLGSGENLKTSKEEEELRAYLETFRESVFESLVEAVEVVHPLPPPPQTQMSRIKEYQERPVDPSILARFNQLTAELQSITSRVSVHRQDVPSIVSAEMMEQ